MLKVIIGSGNTIADRVAVVVGAYNNLETRKDYKGLTFVDDVCVLTYIELSESVELKEEFQYIGSTNIDPQDPDWLTKWNQPELIAPVKIEEVSDEWNDTYPKAWDKDRFQYTLTGKDVHTSVKSPEAPGSTEDKKSYSDTES